MKEFNTLDDFDFRDRTVLLRVDINCPLNKDDLSIIDDNRIRQITQTVSELLGKGAKLAIIAHQGRKGDWDFSTLEEHAKALGKYLGREVRYVDDIVGEEAKRAISELGSGEAILLKNVRSLDCEREKMDMMGHARSPLVTELAPLADYYVCDAFGAAHRSHCSLVGFQAVLPSAAGRLMARELSALRNLFERPKRPCVFVIGGAKFGDAITMIDHVLGSGKADMVILVGLAGNAFLKARGVSLGAESERVLERELTPENLSAAEDLLYREGARIQLPVDIAVERRGRRREVLVGDLPSAEPALDIGELSIEKFVRVLKSAGTVFMSGPAGMYEKEGFDRGTRELMISMIRSPAYSVVGGGHTVGAADSFDLTDSFSYVSTAGGALETFILGRPLPVVEALKHAYLESS